MFTWLDRFQPLGVLIARIVLGTIMLVHGWHKIFPRGSLYSFAQTVGHLSLPYWLGYVAAFTEFSAERCSSSACSSPSQLSA